MRIELVAKCSDHNLPVLDIHFSSPEEAFAMGRIFETIIGRDLCSWSLETGIRIPLVIATDFGLVDYKRSGDVIV